MKTAVIAMVGMLSLGLVGVTGAEINSRVIHDYDYFGVGYGYLHDVADLDVNGHGPVGEFSFEEAGFLFGISGGYFWLEDIGSTEINLWDVTASVGYVFRLFENHVNLIPQFGGSYGGIQLDDSFFGEADEESWSILPGIGLSYAPCNRFAINGGYAYVYNFDSEDEDHVFSAGAKFAILDQIGLAVNANFSKEFGFTGVVGGVEFHY